MRVIHSKNLGSKTKELWKNPEYRKHMSEVHMGHSKPKNAFSFKKGNKMSEELMSLLKNRTGKNNPMFGKHPWNWMGGISLGEYPTDWTNTLRRSIRERDNYTCQICGRPQGDTALSIHHIDYNKKNCNPTNLVTLCRSCHTKTNFNRNYWIEYFNNKNG